VPHFIGFGFSDPPPLDREFTHTDNARLVSKLMHLLGFSGSGYVVQGGDLGAATAPVVASIDPACKLVHVNQLNMLPPPEFDVQADISAGKYTPDEIESLRNAMEFGKTGTAFIQVDGTRPATAGYIVGSSPVSLLAWIGEKMIRWTDKTPETDLILTNLSLYWFSGCYPTSIYCHREVIAEFAPLMDGWKLVDVPMGYSWFKKEIASPPKLWIDHSGKVTWYRKHDMASHRHTPTCLKLSSNLICFGFRTGWPFCCSRAARRAMERYRGLREGILAGDRLGGELSSQTDFPTSR
jgi:microsomal epoxide hydrolase